MTRALDMLVMLLALSRTLKNKIPQLSVMGRITWDPKGTVNALAVGLCNLLELTASYFWCSGINKTS